MDSPAATNLIPPPEIPLSTDRARKWYALYTLSNHEKRVEEHLRMKGIEVFLPLSTVERRWKNRTTAKLKIPLFAGYVFTHILPTERVRVLEAPSALWIVGSGREPLPLPDHEIEILRTSLHLRQVDPYPYLKVGERTRIRSGPLAGIEGVVVRKDDRLRVVLSIDLIRQSVAVHVEADELEPCSNWRGNSPGYPQIPAAITQRQPASKLRP
jgi:transcription antitermination factor NusG